MRPIFLLLAVTAALALGLGCGSGDSTAGDAASTQRREELLGPEIAPPKAPPPKQLVIKNVEVGTGPVAKRGDLAKIHYLTVLYKTGELLERWWEARDPVEYVVGSSRPRPGFAKGVEGMRVGGERELFEPGRFVSTGEPLIHWIKLVSLGPDGG